MVGHLILGVSVGCSACVCWKTLIGIPVETYQRAGADHVWRSAISSCAQQVVTLYARRMQIESSFRDLKLHRYGQGFEDSLTRKGPRSLSSAVMVARARGAA